ncbi:MAG: hypothetical protein ABI589_10215 [Burkholderiales bacterium]
MLNSPEELLMKTTVRISATMLGAAALLASFAAAACGDQASAEPLDKKLGLTPSVAGSATAVSHAPSVASVRPEGNQRTVDRRASAGAPKPSLAPQHKDGTLLARYHNW